MFSNILLCSDGSEHSRRAALIAGEIAKRFQGELTLISVFNPSSALASFAMAPEAAPPDEFVTAMGEETHANIQQTTGDILKELGVTFQSRSECGYPVDTILDVAQNIKADLIIVGSRGLSEWNALLIGGVSDGVLHRAACPVLIARGEQTTFSKILLASDSSAGAYRATMAAGELSRKMAAPLTILNVLEPLGPLARLLPEKADSGSALLRVREIVAARIRSVAEQTGAVYTIRQQIGHAAETIVRYATENEYPLIVLGSRGIGALQALALGSVSNRVAHHAGCSVLVVR